MSFQLAPLHGVTTRTFRKAFLAHFRGFDEVFAPFVLALPRGAEPTKHFKDLAPIPGLAVATVPQLLGNDPEAFLAGTRILADLGYAEVNWNLGCPYAMVAKKGRGAGLLPETDRIVAFLGEVCPRSALPVSLKVRLGWKDPGDLLRLLPRLEGLPLTRIIIHPRLGIQMYRGRVDLDGFEAAAALTSHSLGYNGDIVNLEGYRRLRARFPRVQAWMLGRGALSDPFLAESLQGLSPCASLEAPLARLRAFHDELYRGYREVLFGPGHVLDKMKEVWSYLGANFGSAREALEGLARAKGFEGYEEAVDRVFAAATWKATRHGEAD